MPNWVFNHLTIKKEYLGKIMNSEGDVDFNMLNMRRKMNNGSCCKAAC